MINVVDRAGRKGRPGSTVHRLWSTEYTARRPWVPADWLIVWMAVQTPLHEWSDRRWWACPVMTSQVRSVDIRRLPSARLMLGNRRRRWTNIKPALGSRLESAGWLDAGAAYKQLSIAQSYPDNDRIWYKMLDKYLNPLTVKLFNLNFHPLEVVSRWRDPQLQVSENYSDLTIWRSTVFKYCWLMSHFIFNMFKRWYLMC